MKSTGRRGFLISLILHSVCLLILAFSFLLSSCSRRKVVNPVFELQATPQQEVTSLIRDNSRPLAKIEPKVLSEPKIEPKLKVENTIKESAGSKSSLSYEEFMKKEGRVKPKEVKVIKKVINVPKIATKDVRSSLESKLSSIKAPDANEWLAYEGYLRGLIDGQWDYPESFAGYKNGAIFEFDVDRAGRIVKVRIVKTSGCHLFDESVLKAFSKVSGVRPQPYGKADTLKLTFSKK